MTRDQIERSSELRRGYAQEYREALKMTPDRDTAREIARVNLTERVHGREPMITRDAAERLGPGGLREALGKAGPSLDLAKLNAIVKPVRMVVSIMRRAANEMER